MKERLTAFTSSFILPPSSFLNNVREVPARAREPPVAEQEGRDGERREVREARKVRRRAFEHDAPVAAHERSEGVEFQQWAEALGHCLLRVDDRRQIHPSHQREPQDLRRVAYEN